MEELYLTVGRTIRQIRKAKDISQEELAEMLDVSRTFIGHLERGEKKISLETLFSITEYLDTNLEEFFSLTKYSEESLEMFLPTFFRIKELSNKDKLKIKKIVDAILDNYHNV